MPFSCFWYYYYYYSEKRVEERKGGDITVGESESEKRSLFWKVFRLEKKPSAQKRGDALLRIIREEGTERERERATDRGGDGGRERETARERGRVEKILPCICIHRQCNYVKGDGTLGSLYFFLPGGAGNNT